MANWNVPFGYGIKSLYGNINELQGTYMTDAKIFATENKRENLLKKLNGKPCFSTSSYVINEQRDLIQSLYPNKSRWER